MVYYNPHIIGDYNPLYTLNKWGAFFFIAHLPRNVLPVVFSGSKLSQSSELQ